MGRARKHHFVPQFYLAGFTPSGTRDDSLFVLDRQTGRQWQSSLTDAGCERDFYMLELDGKNDPQAIESFFARVEDHGAQALRRVVETGEVPTGEDYNKLIG